MKRRILAALTAISFLIQGLIPTGFADSVCDEYSQLHPRSRVNANSEDPRDQEVMNEMEVAAFLLKMQQSLKGVPEQDLLAKIMALYGPDGNDEEAKKVSVLPLPNNMLLITLPGANVLIRNNESAEWVIPGISDIDEYGPQKFLLGESLVACAFVGNSPDILGSMMRAVTPMYSESPAREMMPKLGKDTGWVMALKGSQNAGDFAGSHSAYETPPSDDASVSSPSDSSETKTSDTPSGQESSTTPADQSILEASVPDPQSTPIPSTPIGDVAQTSAFRTTNADSLPLPTPVPESTQPLNPRSGVPSGAILESLGGQKMPSETPGQPQATEQTLPLVPAYKSMPASEPSSGSLAAQPALPSSSSTDAGTTRTLSTSTATQRLLPREQWNSLEAMRLDLFVALSDARRELDFLIDAPLAGPLPRVSHAMAILHMALNRLQDKDSDSASKSKWSGLISTLESVQSALSGDLKGASVSANMLDILQQKSSSLETARDMVGRDIAGSIFFETASPRAGDPSDRNAFQRWWDATGQYEFTTFDRKTIDAILSILHWVMNTEENRDFGKKLDEEYHKNPVVKKTMPFAVYSAISKLKKPGAPGARELWVHKKHLERLDQAKQRLMTRNRLTETQANKILHIEFAATFVEEMFGWELTDHFLNDPLEGEMLEDVAHFVFLAGLQPEEFESLLLLHRHLEQIYRELSKDQNYRSKHLESLLLLKENWNQIPAMASLSEEGIEFYENNFLRFHDKELWQGPETDRFGRPFKRRTLGEIWSEIMIIKPRLLDRETLRQMNAKTGFSNTMSGVIASRDLRRRVIELKATLQNTMSPDAAGRTAQALLSLQPFLKLFRRLPTDAAAKNMHTDLLRRRDKHIAIDMTLLGNWAPTGDKWLVIPNYLQIQDLLLAQNALVEMKPGSKDFKLHILAPPDITPDDARAILARMHPGLTYYYIVHTPDELAQKIMGETPYPSGMEGAQKLLLAKNLTTLILNKERNPQWDASSLGSVKEVSFRVVVTRPQIELGRAYLVAALLGSSGFPGFFELKGFIRGIREWLDSLPLGAYGQALIPVIRDPGYLELNPAPSALPYSAELNRYLASAMESHA